MTDFLHPLGHKDDKYYYLSSSNRQITVLTPAQHNKANFISLMPFRWWAKKYYNENEKKMDWDTPITDLMEQCRLRGIFDDSKVRGTGVWRDGDKYLINLGTSLYYYGMEQPLVLEESDFIYEIGPKMRKPTLAVLEEGKQLLDVCSLINWDTKDADKLLAGWLCVAPVAGALEWRPHVWLTGSSGTGKSWLMENLIEPFVHDRGFYFKGNTTEAGIRQTLGASSKPVIFDEFETQDEHSQKRIQFIMELFRQASSHSEGHVVKGSPSGNAIQYSLGFSGLVASIRTQLGHESDRNRFAVLELGRKREGSDEKFTKLQSAVVGLTQKYIDAIFSRTFDHLEEIRANIEMLWRVIRARYSARMGQQYGALLGGYWELLHPGILMTQEQAEALVSSVSLEAADEVETKEEMECFEHLMGLQIDVAVTEAGHKQQHSIENLVGRAWRDFNDSAVGPLERIGIRVHEGALYVRNKHPELAKLYRGTKWGTNWASSLKRLPGGVKKTVSIGGGSHYCAIVPLDGLLTPF